MRIYIILVATLNVANIAYAKTTPLKCHIEDGTNKAMCIAPSETEQNGDLRASPFYKGGIKEIDKTSYTFLVNCKTQVSTLQDKTGVNFGGATCFTTPVTITLCQDICKVSNPKIDKKITQFN